MSHTSYEVRAGTYYDSIILMQLQKSLSDLDGVIDAGVVMATEANREVLRASGLPIDAVSANADDLVIVVKADSEVIATDAIGQVDALMAAKRSSGGGGGFRPKTLQSASKMAPASTWVSISINGRYATAVANKALDLGKHVFLYSDNVSIEDEAKLKQKARDKGLLVMGPDCGTAIINGIGLGFANRVSTGRIGLVAASGTGLQSVTTEIENLSGGSAGISQAIGTGGRDLKDAIGGITMLQGLDHLKSDDATDVIVLISKPPSPAVVNRLLASAYQSNKPVIVYLQGYAPAMTALGNIHFAQSLTHAAALAVRVYAEQQKPALPAAIGKLRGLFAGGTLASEAALLLRSVVTPIRTNIGVGQPLTNPLQSEGHTLIDLGGDEFTQGRLHPMMDNDLRLRRLRDEGADAETGLILLDMVLGEGAHADPASEFVPVIAEIKAARPNLPMVVLVVGTSADFQQTSAQVGAFQDSGCIVFTNPATCFEAVAHMLLPAPAESDNTPIQLSTGQLSVLTVGLESFHDSVVEQGGQSIHVDWKPPAGGNEKMMALLARLKAGK